MYDRMTAHALSSAPTAGAGILYNVCRAASLMTLRNRLFIVLIIGLLAGRSTVGQSMVDLRDVDGVEHRQAEWDSKRAVVVFFTTTECPLSNGYIPEMNRLQKEYAARNVAFYAVEVDTALTDRDVRKHAKDFAIAYPVLIDKRQTLVRLAGATATPEVAVLSNKGAVLYLGRIDNRVEDFDQHRNVVTEHDLREALDAILAGRAVPHATTKVVGCAIPMKTSAR
jgi:thiol-disulfide isomerase/thioredoxin